MPGNVTLDIARMEEQIVKLAMKGGAKGAQYALGRIQMRAPVRKLFRGTTYREDRGFREPRIRRASFREETGAVTSVRDRETRVNRIEGSSVRGHANSQIPLFRLRTKGGGTAFLAGDFRQVDSSTGKLRAVKPDFAVEIRGGKSKRLKIKEISAGQIRVTGGLALTSDGAYEVRSGRANFTQGGITRVGGRLRGELHVEGPFRESGHIWWYVVSRTKENGRLYGRDQEFGNRHNRPHPFLRPGLQESRGHFRTAVRSALKEGTRRR